jgi:hypothetical protein
VIRSGPVLSGCHYLHAWIDEPMHYSPAIAEILPRTVLLVEWKSMKTTLGPVRALHGSPFGPIGDRRSWTSQLALIPKKICAFFYLKIEDFLYVFRACWANLLRGVVKCTSAAGPNGDPWIALGPVLKLEFRLMLSIITSNVIQTLSNTSPSTR